MFQKYDIQNIIIATTIVAANAAIAVATVPKPAVAHNATVPATAAEVASAIMPISNILEKALHKYSYPSICLQKNTSTLFLYKPQPNSIL